MINKLTYKTVNPQLISLSENLNKLGITHDQLIVISILAGTDYNIGGVKGIGQKKALNLVLTYGNNFEALFKEAKWEENFDVSWKEIFDLIKNMHIRKDYELKWEPVDKDAGIKLLVEEHDFGRERVEKTIDKLLKGKRNKLKKGLGEL